MLDAFKKTDATRQQAAELESLIAASREERAALSMMISQVQVHSAKLVAASKSLQALEQRAGDSPVRLEEVDARLARAEELLAQVEKLALAVRAQLESTPSAPAKTSSRRGSRGAKSARKPD